MPMYFPDNGASAPLKEPVLTRTNGKLSSITYNGGEIKTFNYVNDVLTTIVLNDNGTITTKTLNYTGGVLTSITEV